MQIVSLQMGTILSLLITIFIAIVSYLIKRHDRSDETDKQILDKLSEIKLIVTKTEFKLEEMQKKLNEVIEKVKNVA